MSRGGEPRAKTLGKCVTCGLVVREGDEAWYGPNQDLLHKNCNDANRREVDRWNEDVRKDREARG